MIVLTKSLVNLVAYCIDIFFVTSNYIDGVLTL
jgi:hypothetical protein